MAELSGSSFIFLDVGCVDSGERVSPTMRISQRGCTIPKVYAGSMPVFLASNDRGPLRLSTAFRIIVLNLLIPHFANSHWI
ncbi:hypothetical protein TNCV_3049181 [Trichonephila clavipes]|nr:hypothetical protein TNCV_3049181 [Trichonephila clavipes]